MFYTKRNTGLKKSGFFVAFKPFHASELCASQHDTENREFRACCIRGGALRLARGEQSESAPWRADAGFFWRA
jgi:hypothetical protein